MEETKIITLAEIRKLYREYLLTLDDEEDIEYYMTRKDYAENEVARFIRWLSEKK